MLLDDQASVLTRIWPVFEVWVNTRLKLRFQMFLHSWELNFHSDALGARMARDKIEKLDLEAVKSSVEADKTRILNVKNNEGGMPVVLWQVKRTSGGTLWLADSCSSQALTRSVRCMVTW